MRSASSALPGEGLERRPSWGLMHMVPLRPHGSVNLRQALDAWLLALEGEGRRPATLATYQDHWRPLIGWLCEHNLTDLEDLRPLILRQYLAEYSRTHAPYSTRSVFISLRAFLRWAEQEGWVKGALANVKAPRTPEVVKGVYARGELRALFAALREGRTPLELRNAAAVYLLTDTGLRASELCALTLSDLAGDNLTVRQTKSGRVRLAFLGAQSQAVLNRYLSRGRPRLRPQGPWLLVSVDGRQWTRNGLRKVLEELSERVGFHLNAHKFRHTWSTQLAQAGTEARALQELAGWADIRLAQRYVHLTGADLREAHRRAQPVDGL